MVLRDGPCHVLDLAARKAFWQLCRQDVVRYAALRSISVSPGNYLFCALVESVQGILKVLEESALQIVAQRMADNRRDEQFSDNLLGMDEVVQLFDRSDREALSQEQKKRQQAKQWPCRNSKVSLSWQGRGQVLQTKGRRLTSPSQP